MQIKVRLDPTLANRWARRLSKQSFARASRALAPTRIALTFAGVAHVQRTMDFSGAQTLMTTFKTFVLYAGAVICFGGLVFAGIRMMSGRFQVRRSDKDLGVRCGDLGTVTRLCEDQSMTVKFDSGKTISVSPEKFWSIDYGNALDGLSPNRAERVIATGDGLTQQVSQGASSKADRTLYIGTPAPAGQDFSAAKEMSSPEIPQSARQQHDFGIGF
jgi:hypothetical protein